MNYHPDDVNSWPGFRPLMIAHDVGCSRDRSTAVVGGNSPFGRRLLGIHSAIELPQNLFGTARASALAVIDRSYGCNGLIIADLSYDPTYAEVLVQTFGQRAIGLHISRFGNGMNHEVRACSQGHIPIYQIGRTYLIELLHRELQSDLVRSTKDPQIRRAYQQLHELNMEFREGGIVYSCPPGHHDDLGISCAMLVWAAQHPHLPYWVRNYELAQRPRRPRPKANWSAWT
jgi:hypothetical protein